MLHEARLPLQPRTSLKGEECALFVLLFMLGFGTHWGPRTAQQGDAVDRLMGLAEARQQALGSQCQLAFLSSLLLLRIISGYCSTPEHFPLRKRLCCHSPCLPAAASKDQTTLSCSLCTRSENLNLQIRELRKPRTMPCALF